MDFFEDGDFTNFDDEEEIEVDELECFSCKAHFEVETGSEPTHCPACGIEFIPCED